jgi:hypothetical protein
MFVNRFQQQVMIDPVKEGFDIRINHPVEMPATLTGRFNRLPSRFISIPFAPLPLQKLQHTYEIVGPSVSSWYSDSYGSFPLESLP